MAHDPSRSGLTRRNVLTGAVALGATVALPSILRAQDAYVPEASRDPAEPMPPRSHHTLTTLQNGWILVAGGVLFGRPTSNVLLIDPNTGAASVAAPLLVARARHAAVSLPDGRVLVLGGFNGQYLRAVEAYDPSQNRWTVMPSMDSPRADFAVAVTGGGLFLCGGSHQNGLLGHSFHRLSTASVNP